MSLLKTLQAGHFLTFELWTSAKKLLDYQINDKPKHKTYNTLNFYYFNEVKDLVNRLEEKTYYKTRISNNLFYGLEREFFFHKYTIPKTGIGLRTFAFFSYPMQQLMYAFGLYLLRLSQQFLIDKKSEKIKSYYGGNLKFNEETKELVLNTDTTLYYSNYRSFKRELVNETANPTYKVMLRLDIQNYYDNISIGKLLNLIEENIKPSEIKFYKFDSSTKEQIEFFYRFLSNGIDNIPQSDNNIISNFIGHLYLTFGDFIIEDAILLLNKEYEIVKDYKIIRYVDDIYISIDFKEEDLFDMSYNEGTRNGFIYQLLNKIADEFYKQLTLRFNGKAKMFSIGIESDMKGLLDLIKKVSEDYPEPESEKELAVKDKVNRLISLIDTIKGRDVSQVYEDLKKMESETLKDVYDKSVLGLLSTPANIVRLERQFEDFNFDLLRVYPQPLIILITYCPKAKARLEDYLLIKPTLTTFDRGLLVVLLCQSNFSNLDLFKKLQSNEQLKPIFEFMKHKKVVDEKNSGYYNLNFKTIIPLTKQVSFIEQIRQRVYTERQGHFSIALNHLLNEIQLACCILEARDIKSYDEPATKAFLTTKGIANPIRNKISNLFNRRNSNPISHPGSDTRVAWAVEKEEYMEYRKYVGLAMKAISE